MQWIRCACLLLLVVAGVCATGCGNRSSKIKVAFVTNNTETFWDYAEAGCEEAARKYDVDVAVRRAADGTPANQKQIIDTLLDNGYQAIAVSVIDPDVQNAYLRQVSARVPLLTQDNDAPQSGRKCYIGTNNVKAGKAAGKLVKKALPQGGTIAIFVGQMEALNAQERRQGVLDELAGETKASGKVFGNYKLFSSGSKHGAFTDGIDRGRAKSNADFVLDKNPGNDLCLIGLYAYNPPTILAALKTVKQRLGKVKIVAFDEEQQTLDGIANGTIEGTIVQHPYQFGYQAVEMMAHLVRDEPAGIPENGLKEIPYRVITRENVAEFRETLAKERKK